MAKSPSPRQAIISILVQPIREQSGEERVLMAPTNPSHQPARQDLLRGTILGSKRNASSWYSWTWTMRLLSAASRYRGVVLVISTRRMQGRWGKPSRTATRSEAIYLCHRVYPGIAIVMPPAALVKPPLQRGHGGGDPPGSSPNSASTWRSSVAPERSADAAYLDWTGGRHPVSVYPCRRLSWESKSKTEVNNELVLLAAAVSDDQHRSFL